MPPDVPPYNDGSFWVRINGTGHAFAREIGCDCSRCSTINFNMRTPSGKLEPFAGWDDPPWRAATSGSILTSDCLGDVKSYVTIDFGPGVGDSLAMSRLKGLENISAILLSHWHPDHVRGLNQLCESVPRSRRWKSMPPIDIPVYCTQATYDWLRDKGGLAFELSKMKFVEVEPGRQFNVQGDPPIDVVALEVAHSGIQGAVIFVAEIGVEKRKVIFCWDIDRPDKQRPSDRKSNIDVIRENGALLRDAEILFMAVNTYSEDQATGHVSLSKAVEYVKEIAPKQAYLVHMSGHEDGKNNRGWGLDDAGWEKLAQEELPNTHVALQGMLLPL
jgi:ribonuclease BN (tRNA processing enzyme)